MELQQHKVLKLTQMIFLGITSVDVFGPKVAQNEIFQVLLKVNAWNISGFFACSYSSIKP